MWTTVYFQGHPEENTSRTLDIIELVRLFFRGKPKRRMKMETLRRLVSDESGQTMVEYGLLIALISIAVIAVLVALGPRIASFFQSVDDRLSAASPAAPAA